MSDGSFASFLGESFQALDRELPQAHALLCRTLRGRQIEIQVGNERLGVTFDGAPHLVSRAERPTIFVDTSKAEILALIDGASTLAESILADGLALRGNVDELLRFHDGLMAYLHGALRAPSFPGLLRAYRDAGGLPLTVENP